MTPSHPPSLNQLPTPHLDACLFLFLTLPASHRTGSPKNCLAETAMEQQMSSGVVTVLNSLNDQESMLRDFCPLTPEASLKTLSSWSMVWRVLLRDNAGAEGGAAVL